MKNAKTGSRIVKEGNHEKNTHPIFRSGEHFSKHSRGRNKFGDPFKLICWPKSLRKGKLDLVRVGDKGDRQSSPYKPFEISNCQLFIFKISFFCSSNF